MIDNIEYLVYELNNLNFEMTSELCFHNNYIYTIITNKLYFYYIYILIFILFLIMSSIFILSILYFDYNMIIYALSISMTIYILLFLTIDLFVDKYVEYILPDNIFLIFTKYFNIPDYCNIVKMCEFKNNLYYGCSLQHIIYNEMY